MKLTGNLNYRASLAGWQHCPESEAGTQIQASCCPCSPWSCGSRPPGGQSCSRGWEQLSRCQRSSLVGGRNAARQVLPSPDLLSNQTYQNKWKRLLDSFLKLNKPFFKKLLARLKIVNIIHESTFLQGFVIKLGIGLYIKKSLCLPQWGW